MSLQMVCFIYQHAFCGAVYDKTESEDGYNMTVEICNTG